MYLHELGQPAESIQIMTDNLGREMPRRSTRSGTGTIRNGTGGFVGASSENRTISTARPHNYGAPVRGGGGNQPYASSGRKKRSAPNVDNTASLGTTDYMNEPSPQFESFGFAAGVYAYTPDVYIPPQPSDSLVQSVRRK